LLHGVILDQQLLWCGRLAFVYRGLIQVSKKCESRTKAEHHPGGELEIPAYEAMQTNSRLGQRLLEILMHGVSTRHYRQVLPEMAQTVGVSKSSVSREFVDASEKALKELAERRFDEQDLLIVYLDGLVFGEQHVIAAIGVDSEGYKHVLGLRDGASENATVCQALLADLVERGVKPGRRRLFVIDGSKALRAAIDAVYGKDNPVQRCRNHKRKNVLDHVSDPMKDTMKATMNAAYRLDADQGMARLEKLAKMLEQEHPSAAASLREGLAETFTVNRLGLPATLRRCLCTTNVNRVAALRRTPTNRPREPLARWRNGVPLGRDGLVEHGAIVPLHHGIPAVVDAGSEPGRPARNREDCSAKEGWLTYESPSRHPTFNWQWGILADQDDASRRTLHLLMIAVRIRGPRADGRGGWHGLAQ
jgi:hypothetical protein